MENHILKSLVMLCIIFIVIVSLILMQVGSIYQIFNMSQALGEVLLIACFIGIISPVLNLILSMGTQRVEEVKETLLAMVDQT